MQINQDKVKQYLPHREPFLFVDSVESVVFESGEFEGKVENPKMLQGAKVTAKYRTKEDHPIFKGHFPGRPVLPGVIQIEMMAQVSSFICAKLHDDPFGSHADLDVALVGVENAKFRRPIFPEKDLVVECSLTRIRLPMVSFSCKIFSESQLMSECDVMASVHF